MQRSLFDRATDLLALQKERAQLIRRIKKLSPHSHRRIGLQERLQRLTHRFLAAKITERQPNDKGV